MDFPSDQRSPSPFAPVLALLCFFALSGLASEPPGLTAGPGGGVLREGKPFRGIGINYFDCFLRTLKRGDDTSYDAGFAVLAAKGIPFVRFCATGFWPRDMQLYREDRDEYFRRLDGVVRSAERHGIGLVPSLFWHFACVPDLVGEPMDQWVNPASKTRAWMAAYVREVVTRYRESPAIWAWELGNEFSLQAQLPNAKDHRPATHPTLGTPESRSERDELTFEMVRAVFSAFATEVRKHDPRRLVFTGDSFPRLSAWHQEKENSWTHDTPEQFADMLRRANPDPVSGISLHAYEDDDQRFADAMKVSREMGKPVFVGEFGAQGGSPEQAAKFRRLLKAIVDHDVPLAAVWVFDLPSQKDFNITADNARAWQLDLIADTGRKRASAAPAATNAPAPRPSVEHWTFLDNGHVRLGVNMDAGGSIGWFSHSRSSENLLNTFDHGRYVQQSFYGDKDGSDWNGKPWRYNPVQGGSWKGVPATVLESREDAASLYVKTRPRQWASGSDVADMIMEQWLRLEGGLARARFRMTFTWSVPHQATHQELPAVFVTPSYETLVFCEKGQAPWTGAPLTRRKPGFPNETVRFAEPWAAWESAKGQALGILFPHTDIATTYRVRDSGIGDCSYIAPIRTFALVPGLVYEHEIVLAIGTVDQIRAIFTKVRAPAK